MEVWIACRRTRASQGNTDYTDVEGLLGCWRSLFGGVWIVGLLAPRPRERSALDPFVSCGDSFLAMNKDLKEFKELKESIAHRGSDSSRV